MFRSVFFILLIASTNSTAIAQQSMDLLPINQNLGSFINTAKVAETSGYGQSGRIYGESYLYADRIQSSNYTPRNSAGLNTNNPHHLYNPRIVHTYTVFETRRMNSYYKELEVWRREEKARLKKEGLWGREAIEDLYSP
jgi:hypothetical protein